jgi:flagellar basal-body rod modification protein FlgD
MAVGAVSAKDTTTSSSNSTTASSNNVTSDQFMTLITTELQNQDPTSPMDPTAFMSQLMQLNQLEQTMSIREILQQTFGSASSS